MSGSDVSLYDEVIEGLRCNRELELYYNDSTYGIVTYGALWQLWKNKDLLIINGRSLKDIIKTKDCGLLLM